jgi:hypothetical protein
MKAMKLSQYFEIINPEYVYLRLIPLKSIRNYNSDKIINAVASLYKNLFQRIYINNKKLFFNTKIKVVYYIYITKSSAEFYFIIPKTYLNLIKDKIGDTWKGITIVVVESLPYTQGGIRSAITYKKEDALSIATDKRSNALLSSIMSTIDIMEEGDKVGVFFNFVPCDQQTWRAQYDRTIEKLSKGFPIDREKISSVFALKMLVNLIIKLSEFITSFISGDDPQNTISRRELALSSQTNRKRDERIVQTQIVAYSDSADKARAHNNLLSIGESFKTVTGDNELVYHPIKPAADYSKPYFQGAETIKMTAAECGNFVALPGAELLEQYKCVERIEVLESAVPVELQQGIIRIGDVLCRGNTEKAYVTTDQNYKNLTLVIIGPTRAGKTVYIGNIAKDTVRAGQCTILFDFCGNCELSDDVSISMSNVLTIDCSDFDTLQGLGYNEVNPAEPNTFLRYRNAKMMSIQLMTLINTIVDSDGELKARMERYLECASLVTFMSGGSINDVFQVLTDHTHRARFINAIPGEQADNLSEYVQGLFELDDTDKAGNVIGTKFSLISGIVDRVNRLKQNTYMELMLKKSCANNINLVDKMQKAQLICLRMPESMFSTEKEKDVYCTYWITKIMLALIMRKYQYKALNPVNIIVDELYQVPSCQDFIRSKLSQMAKFQAKMIISCHYLGQIKIIRNELKSANSSYMLLAGADKDNFNELREELDPYTVTDVLSLKRYHALCLMRYEQGYARFVAKLPPP